MLEKRKAYAHISVYLFFMRWRKIVFFFPSSSSYRDFTMDVFCRSYVLLYFFCSNIRIVFNRLSYLLTSARLKYCFFFFVHYTYKYQCLTKRYTIRLKMTWIQPFYLIYSCLYMFIRTYMYIIGNL